MIETRSGLVSTLQSYNTAFPEEHNFINQFLELLKHERCFFRDFLPGHITASSFIINEESNKILLVHHAKLKRWLQPGGHADGDENVFAVALREIREETGLEKLNPIGNTLFDIDIHPIPKRNGFPLHFHYDVRFAFQTSEKNKLMISDESVDLQWKNFDALEEITNHNQSILRMREKILKPIAS